MKISDQKSMTELCNEGQRSGFKVQMKLCKNGNKSDHALY